jgi:hypothetical protein
VDIEEGALYNNSVSVDGTDNDGAGSGTGIDFRAHHTTVNHSRFDHEHSYAGGGIEIDANADDEDDLRVIRDVRRHDVDKNRDRSKHGGESALGYSAEVQIQGTGTTHDGSGAVRMDHCNDMLGDPLSTATAMPIDT